TAAGAPVEMLLGGGREVGSLVGDGHQRLGPVCRRLGVACPWGRRGRRGLALRGLGGGKGRKQECREREDAFQACRATLSARHARSLLARYEAPSAIGDLNLLFAEWEPNIKCLERLMSLAQNFLATRGMTLYKSP